MGWSERTGGISGGWNRWADGWAGVEYAGWSACVPCDAAADGCGVRGARCAPGVVRPPEQRYRWDVGPKVTLAVGPKGPPCRGTQGASRGTRALFWMGVAMCRKASFMGVCNVPQDAPGVPGVVKGLSSGNSVTLNALLSGAPGAVRRAHPWLGGVCGAKGSQGACRVAWVVRHLEGAWWGRLEGSLGASAHRERGPPCGGWLVGTCSCQRLRAHARAAWCDMRGGIFVNQLPPLFN